MLKRVVLACLVCAAGSTAAHANPFNLKAGDGRVIVTGVYTASPRQFDGEGRVQDALDYDQFNVYIQGEYGLTDKVNLIVAPSIRSVSVQGDSNDSTGLGHTELGVRYEVAKGSNWVFDLQGTVRLPGTGRSFGVAQIGNNDVQYEARALGGYTFGKSFVSLETSYRLRAGRPPSEFHVDASFGTHATSRLLLLASLYGTISDGKGSSEPLNYPDGTSFNYGYKYRYYDLSVSAVYSVTPRFGIQAGATATVAGKNALRQRGPFVGIWYNF
ncbi:MAG: hypothetical protein WC816_00135 [Sphingomonas sp.]|jgi:hypothetical protein